MADPGSEDTDMSEFLDPAGHPPVFSKKRKTGTRAKQTTHPRKGGVSMLQHMFSNPADLHSDSSAGPGGEDTSSLGGEPFSTPPTSPPFPAASSKLPHRPAEGDFHLPDPAERGQESASAAEAPPPVGQEYSNEARVYHAKYDEVSRLYLRSSLRNR